MKLLVDTNLITRLADPSHKEHHIARNALTSVTTEGHDICLVPQNLYEFWVVATRPRASNGLGFDTQQALAELEQLREAFLLLEETADFRPVWEDLVISYNVQGKSAHDARLVAAMKVHGLTKILTFNKQHFVRYQGIDVISPHERVSGAAG